MVKTRLVRGKDGKELHSYSGYDGDPVLVTTTHGANSGSFKSASRTGAGTSIVVAPDGLDGIVLTDLILTTDKVNGATATVQITDGVNTIVLISANVTDAPCNIALSFAGKWEGWQGARVEFVTVGNVKATLAIGYFKIMEDSALPFASWDAKR
jgi:hypothetical protein